MKFYIKLFKYIVIISLMLSFIPVSFSYSNLNYDINMQAKDTRILIIYSYDPGFETILPISNGINSVFKDKGTYLNVEFMNSKGVFLNQYFYNYYMSLKYKLENTSKYDIVFISDDNALIFIQKYGSELFPDTPIVFTGINNWDNAKLASKESNMTGVIEHTSIQATISLAQKLQPNAKKIYGISDDTFTGKAELEKFMGLKYLFPNLEFKNLDLSSITFKDLGSKLSNIDSSDIILLLSAYKDVNLKEYSFKKSTDYILECSNQPVYHIYEHGIEQGLLGGKVVSHYEQGREAALIGKSILEGDSIDNFREIISTKNKYIVNYQTLERYDLDKNLLPKGSILINYEKSFFEKYFIYILAVIIIIIIQSIIIIALINANKIRRSTQLTLENLIYKDNLTGLLSRYAMEKLIDDHLSSLQRNQLALVFIDIDNFKHINDNLGHNFGDVVLKYVANRLAEIEDESISICRFSGDEFLVLANNIQTREETMWLVNNIQQLFDRTIKISNHNLHLTVSMGIALSNTNNVNRINLFKMADLALYEAKANGKNTFSFYEEIMGVSLSEKLEFHDLIKNAMKNSEFELYYQPYNDAITEKIVGFEALIRWFSPNHGYISPYKLIVNAEEMGLIVELGLWIMEDAFIFAKSLNSKRLVPYRISVNLSPVQILQSNFIANVENLVIKTNIDPSWICFEITETSIIESFEITVAILKELLDMGFEIVIDDFGTGYSSLSYLKDLPITGMKIDKSFIDNLAKSSEDMKFVELIIDISRVLNIKVTAEGIEDHDQYLILKTLGCDYIQGYYFGRPASKEETKKLIALE